MSDELVEQEFKVNRVKQIQSASEIRDLLDRLNRLIAEATEAGARVTIDNPGEPPRTITRVDLGVWTTLV